MGVGEGFDADATAGFKTTPLFDVVGAMAAAGAGDTAAVGGEGAADGCLPQLMVKGLATGGGGSPPPALFPVEEAGGVDTDAGGSSVGVEALLDAAATPKVGVAEPPPPKEAKTPPEVGGVLAAPRR